MKKTPHHLLLCLLLTLPAASATGGEKEVVDAMSSLVPGKTPDSIAQAPMKGFYEVAFGTHLFYVSDDGRYVLNGEVIDLEKKVNITEQRRADARVRAVEKVDPASMITYSGESPRHTVTVFTDIDCPYCRKLHSQIDEYNALGIAVRYMAFPRSEKGSPSYQKAVSVWCAKDRTKALTEAKSGKEPEKSSCEDNPVDRHVAVGMELGVSGTPAILLEDGQMLRGYVPPQRLGSILDAQGS